MHLADLANIQLPPKVRKRGRPKGAALTVIGLPKKKGRMCKPQEFRRKSPREKEKGTYTYIDVAVIFVLNL